MEMFQWIIFAYLLFSYLSVKKVKQLQTKVKSCRKILREKIRCQFY